MSMKEDLENLIRNSYQIISESEDQKPFATPKQRMQLERENERQWSDINNYLITYTSICESLKLIPAEDIIEVAAAKESFGDLASRLIAAQTAKQRPLSPPTPVKLPKKGSSTPFERDIHWIDADKDIPPTRVDADRDDSSSWGKSNKEDLKTFRLNYHFAHQFMPKDKEELAQFIVTFTNRGDINLTKVDIVKHVCLVLDVSGSMAVPNKYPHLLEAIPYLFEVLSDNDWLTIIIFSNYSELILSKNVGSCRGNIQEIQQRIDQSGVKFAGTVLSSGLRMAIDEIGYFSQSHPEAVTRLYILTDGQLQDEQYCLAMNPQLQQLKIEVNSFGFGQDFAEETMRNIMQGCPGGRVQWIGNTNDLWKSFYHIGEVAQNIVATNAELELTFPANVTPGDAFRSAPGRQWFGTVDTKSRRFFTSIGTLEKEREYIYAFEVLTHPSQGEREHIATAILHYSFQNEQQIVKQEIVVDRTSETVRQNQVDKEIVNLFLTLEELRNNDPQSLKISLQARLDILRDEDGSPEQIQLLEKALQKLGQEGTIDVLSETERRQMRSDNITVRN